MAVTRLAGITKATVDEGIQGIYADVLEDIEPATLAKIFEQAECTCRFLPVPAELREMAGIGGDAESLASWEFVQKFMERHVERKGPEGYGIVEGLGRIEWTDGKPHCKRIPVPEIPEAIEHAVRIVGGWSRLKEMTDEQYPWVKKEFAQAIANYDRTGRAATRLALAPVVQDMVKRLTGASKTLPSVEPISSTVQEDQ